jgi:putative ABC transport system permease protein
VTVWRTSLRNLVAHKGRMVLSAVAVLLSVAFVCGTLVFTDTMNTTFDTLFAATSADVTVSPKDADGHGGQPSQTGRPATLPVSVLHETRGVRGVREAEGSVVSSSVTVVNADDENMGATTGAPTIAGNWTSTDRSSMKVTSGHLPHGPGQIMVDADTADKHHLKLGDELRVVAVTGDHTARICGIATFQVTNPGAAIVYLDTATAQKVLLGRTGVYTNVDVTAAHGVSDAQVKKNVARALGAHAYTYQTQAENADASRKQMGGFLDVIKYAMLGFAAIAVLVGVFLIVNTFSMLVAQRTREIGLLRAVGASRRQVNRSVLVEAVLLGAVGSVLGVGAGTGLAVGLMKAMGAAGMNLSTSELTIKATTPVVGLLLGVLVTVVAAYLPARRAGRITPMAALREAGTPAGARSGVVRAVLGVLMTAAGGVALVASARAAHAGSGSALLAVGVLLTLVGFVVVGPLLAGGVVRVLSLLVLRVFGPVGRLAERNALRNPRRTGATGAALMIGLALVACLSVVGSSMVASATRELDRSVGADFIIQSNVGQPITPRAARRIERTPHLAHVTHYKLLDASITTPDGTTVTKQTINAASPSYAQDLRVKTTHGDLADAYRAGGMSVFAKFADKHHLQVGDELAVHFAHGRTAHLRLNAITSDDTTIDQGAMYASIATVRHYVPQARMPLDAIMFAAAKDGQEDAAYAALKKSMHAYPQYQVRNQADFKKDLRDQVGQLLNMVYGLLALAIIVAVLGVVNTLALSVVERTREIGLMRAIGLSRRQLRRMIRLESVVIALFGALLGLGLGLGWGATAQQLLALEGLNVLDVPWATIGWVFAGSAVVGLVAALVPAFRAGRMNVLGAIATE